MKIEMEMGVDEEGNELVQEALYSGHDRVKGLCNSRRAPRKCYIVIEKEVKKRTREDMQQKLYDHSASRYVNEQSLLLSLRISLSE